MEKKIQVNAAIIIIGNEILSGRTQDTNTSSIAVWLFLLELYSPLAYVLSCQPRC